jgi:hypothetical protein
MKSLFAMGPTDEQEKGAHGSRFGRRAGAALKRMCRFSHRSRHTPSTMMKSLAVPFVMPLILAGVPAVGWAATFMVSNLADSGPGSLRQAIIDAQSVRGANVVMFDAALSFKKILLTSGPLTIARDLSIVGNGASGPVISTADAMDIFRVSSACTVTFASLVIFRGEDGIQITGNGNTVTITDSLIWQQSSDDGISIDGDRNTVTVKNTRLVASEDNLAVEGNNNIVNFIYSSSSLAREDGIEIDGSDNVVTVKHATINNNGRINPSNRNDGIDMDGDRNVLLVEQVTVSGNGEDGLDIEGAGNRVTVSHSTVTGNGRTGIFNQDSTLTSSVVLYNSLISGNAGFDVAGRFGSAGYNLVGTGWSTGLDAPGDRFGILNPLLGPLQNNGGPTNTHALLPGSPAIDAGDPNFRRPPDFDQRGPAFLRVNSGRIDVGALER